MGTARGAAEVGERPSEAAEREALEESGVLSRAIGLVGIYDNRFWEDEYLNHMYMLLFLCEPVGNLGLEEQPSHAVEVLERGWFPSNALPDDLDPRYAERIPQAFEFRIGGHQSFFDR